MSMSLMLLMLSFVGCSSTQVSGSATLSMQPLPPSFAGQYDFDLLDRVRGKACVKKGGSSFNTKSVAYWMAGIPFERLPSDPLTLSAVAAASFDAIEKIAGADTMLFTRLISEGKEDEVCAWVYGYAIRLKKADSRKASTAEPSRTSEPRDPSADSREDELQ
jgi:hypothetical protein